MYAVILFCLIVALCSFGIVHATNASYNLEGQQAQDAAVSAADGIAMQLSSAFKAALSMVGVSACAIGCMDSTERRSNNGGCCSFSAL
eukprot:scaffold87300_cov20-Tisochrysis_lutea.AAC.2